MANKKENASRLLAGGRQNIAAEVKKQSGINGLLPALGAGPFHLFRLHLDLRCDVLKKVTVTFPSEKVFSQRRPFGSQTLVVAQCRGGNLPNRRQARQNKKRRPIPRVIGSVHCIPTGSIFVSVVARSTKGGCGGKRQIQTPAAVFCPGRLPRVTNVRDGERTRRLSGH